MLSSAFVSAVLLSTIVRGSFVLKRPASEEAIAATNKKIKLDQDYGEFGSGKVISPVTGIKASDMKTIEYRLEKLWNSENSHSNLWMVDIGEKCSPLKKNGLGSQWKHIIGQMNGENIFKYPRLSLCMLTEGILPRPLSDEDKNDVGKKIMTLANLAVPTINSMVIDPDFKNALIGDILSSLGRWIPFASTLQEIWRCETQEDRLRVLKDFDKAWDLKGIFEHASFVLLFPDFAEIMELLKYLDMHLVSSKVFLDSLLNAAIMQDKIDVIEYLHRTSSLVSDLISERLTSGDISYFSGKLLEKLEEWGHLDVKNVSPLRVILTDNVQGLKYFLDKGYFNVSDITSQMLLHARSLRKENVLEFLRSQYGRGVAAVSASERTISCDLEKVKSKIESGIGSISLRPGDYLELSDNINPDCLEVLDYLFGYFRQHESEMSVTETIKIISNDFYAFKVGNLPVLNWIQKTLKNHGLDFPVLTLKMVEEGIENGAYESFKWYKQVLGRRIPSIPDAYKNLRSKKPDSADACERWWLFKGEGVEVEMADLESCLHQNDIRTFQFIHTYFPAELDSKLTKQVFCDSLSNGQSDLIAWATSAMPRKFTGIECDSVYFVPENLLAYRIAHERTNWVPTEKSLERFLSVHIEFSPPHYDLLQWLIMTLNSSNKLQSMDMILEMLARSKTTLLLRLLSLLDDGQNIANNSSLFEAYLQDPTGIYILKWLPTTASHLFGTVTEVPFTKYSAMSDSKKHLIKQLLSEPDVLQISTRLARHPKEVAKWLLNRGHDE